MSTFECRWGHIQAAFGAAGAGGRGETDPRAAWEEGPAEQMESNAGNIPGGRSQVRVSMQHAANTPTPSTLCVFLHRPRAPGTRSSQMSFTPPPGNPGPWVQQRKMRSRVWSMTSPPPLFEISTRNRFAPLCETVCEAVIIGDSIVRHVRATLAESKVHTHCFPDAPVLDVSAQIPKILKDDRERCSRCDSRGG